MSRLTKHQKRGLNARTREDAKEPIVLVSVTKRVRVISKREPEHWYRAVNRPGYAFSTYKRAGKIVRDGRWLEVELLSVDESIFGERVRIFNDGKREAVNIASILRNAKYLDGAGTDILEKVRRTVSEPDAKKLEWEALEKSITTEHKEWFQDEFRQMPKEDQGWPERIYGFLKDRKPPMSDAQLRHFIGSCYLPEGPARIAKAYPSQAVSIT